MNDLFSFSKNALSDGLCEEYKDLWRAAGSDKKKLLALALRQQSIPFIATYCYQGKGFTKEFAEKEFAELINKKAAIQDADAVEGYNYSLWIGENGVLSASDDVLHLMWCKSTLVTVDAYKCPNLYISNKSDVSIVCEGFNSLRIYLFDESNVTLEDVGEESTVLIYKYSNLCKVVEGQYCLGKVKTFNKELRLL